MPSVCTCTGWGKAIGCSGAKFCDEDAPLYAERRATAPANATNPGTSAHFRLLVIGRTEGGIPSGPLDFVNIFTRPSQVRKYDDALETAQALMRKVFAGHHGAHQTHRAHAWGAASEPCRNRVM